MWTAVLATLNLLDGTDYDVWSVNTEAEYHEEGEAVGHALEAHLDLQPLGAPPAQGVSVGQPASVGSQP